MGSQRFRHTVERLSLLFTSSATWKVQCKKSRGTGHWASWALSEAHSPSTSMCLLTNPEALQILSFWIFYGSFLTQTCLIKSLATDSWLKLQEVGLKVPILWSCCWFSWQPAPDLRCFPKVTSFSQQRTPLWLSTLRTEVLGNCKPRTMDEGQM